MKGYDEINEVEKDSKNLKVPASAKFPNAYQSDENSPGYRFKMEEVNYKIISRLAKVCVFCFVFMMIEFFGGWYAGSLAIMTDAAHLLSDLSGFLISMVSLWIALRPADKTLTYGYHRAEVVGALSSVLIIWCLTVWLIFEACHRIYNPAPILGKMMLAISLCGLGFNLIMSKILTSQKIPNAFEEAGGAHADLPEENNIIEPLLNQIENGTNTASINNNNNNNNNEGNNKEIDENENLIMRANALHILGDIIQSIGVVIASTIVYLLQDSHPNIVIVDPICTFIFALIVLYTSIPVTRDCINVLMEASPSGIDVDKLTEEISGAEGVVNVHDVHVWCISIGKPAISLHILSTNPQKTLEKVTSLCNKHGIYHTTIQVEDDNQKHRPSFMKCNHTYDNTIHY